MTWREDFDFAQTPQGAASALRLLPLYNAYQPAYLVGEIVYASTTGALARAAPHTAATKAFFSMTGTGSAGAAPGWETVEAADITNFSEAVDDRVNALIQDGTGITWAYDDGAGTLTPTVTITQYTDEMAQDAAATLIQNGTGITWAYNDSLNTLTPTVTITQYTDEMVDDRVEALIQDGGGIVWTYNDGAGTLTPQVSITTAVTGYEEGTWTPVLSFATPGDLAVGYTVQVGTYTKIGRVVFASFTIITNSFTHTTASGGLQITGLPYAASGTYAYNGAVTLRGVTKAGYTSFASVVQSTNQFVEMFASASAAVQSAITAANMPTGGTVTLLSSVAYHA